MTVRLVVEKQRPILKAGLVMACTALLVVVAYGFYEYARGEAAFELADSRSKSSSLRNEKRALGRELGEVKAEAAALREEVAYLKRSIEIEKTACQTVQDSLEGLQADVSSLREQLAFYQGIVSPQDARMGLRLHEFRIRDTGVPHIYRYEIVLIQAGRHETRAKGTIEMQIAGLESEMPQTYQLQEVSLNNLGRMKFGFRYFQEFAGEFRLPEGFSPLTTTITMKRVGKKAGNIVRTFDWSRIHELGSV